MSIICVRFSSAYFTYAAVIFCLFLIYDLYQTRRDDWKLWPEWTVNCRRVLLYTVGFYGVLLLECIALQDSASISKTLDLAALSLPLFMFAYLSGKYPIDKGIMWGLFAGIGIVLIYGLLREYWLFPGERFKSFFAHGPHFGTAVCMWLPLCAYYWKKQKTDACASPGG